MITTKEKDKQEILVASVAKAVVHNFPKLAKTPKLGTISEEEGGFNRIIGYQSQRRL